MTKMSDEQREAMQAAWKPITDKLNGRRLPPLYIDTVWEGFEQGYAAAYEAGQRAERERIANAIDHALSEYEGLTELVNEISGIADTLRIHE